MRAVVRDLRSVARALPFAIALGAAAVPARAVEPHRSSFSLVSSNGWSAVAWDAKKRRVVRFTEHLWQATSKGQKTRNFAYDAYPGLRAGAAATWLTELPAVAEVEPGTGIVHAARAWQGLDVDEWVFAPADLAAHAFVTIVRAKRVTGTAVPVDAYALYNLHLGAGAPDPGASGETAKWDGARDAWIEWGPSGAAAGYGGIGASTHHGASPKNPWQALPAGSDLADNDGTGGPVDDAVAGLQKSLGAPGPGGEAWAGWFAVVDPGGDVAPRIDAARAWIAGRTPAALLADERAAWKAWHAQGAAPAGLDALESALYAHAMATLRMAQVAEPGPGAGQIVASLPPGKWNIAWVRDMAYAAAALARGGHVEEARRALAFVLGAQAGAYQKEVGKPYKVSVVRYSGDGVEESDLNEDGPNVEFDGFGLFLWEMDAWARAAKDPQALAAKWPVVRDEVADVLVSLLEPSGLVRPDSSIWEVHWNGKQKRFAYTTIAAAAGLCAAASLAERYDPAPARKAAYLEAGRKAQAAIVTKLAAPDGTIAQSAEALAGGKAFLDAAAIEAVGLGLLDPKGRSAAATLQAMSQGLVPPSGRGFMRNDDGGWYDSQEWVFVDLRAEEAMRLAGKKADAAALLGWNTKQAAENWNQLSELHDAVFADYAGESPMAGFGAGAWALAVLARAEGAAPKPCGMYAAEPSPPDADGGADAGADARAEGGAGAGAEGGAGAGAAGGSEQGGGCGCRAARGTGAASIAGAWAAAMAAITWCRGRCTRRTRSRRGGGTSGTPPGTSPRTHRRTPA